MKPKFIFSILAVVIFSCSQPSVNEETAETQSTEVEQVIVQETSPEVELTKTEEVPVVQSISKPGNTKDYTYSFSSMDDFYKANEAKAQTFQVRSDRDTVIKGKKGTEVLVRQASFVDIKGNSVTEPVEIAMKEYTSMEDFILNGMHSTSQGKLLETGGMFHITATAGGEEVYLKRGQTLSLKIPTEEKKEGMQYFRGVETENGLDWVVQNAAVSVKETSQFASRSIISSSGRINFEVSSDNEYYYGKYGYGWAKPRCLECEEYFTKAITHPEVGSVEEKSGIVVASFVIQEDGSVTNLWMQGGGGPACKEVVKKAIESFSNWVPEIVEGKILRPNVQLRYSFQFHNESGKYKVFHPDYSTIFNVLDKEEYAAAQSGMAKFQKERDNFTANAKEGSDEVITSFYNKGLASSYILEASNMGFINCDRFGNYPPGTLTSIKVNKDEGFNDVKLVFSNIRSLMQGVPTMEECVFVNIPVGEKVTLIGIKEINGQPEFAFKEMTIERNQTIDLDYKPITYKELKEQLARLN